MRELTPAAGIGLGLAIAFGPAVSGATQPPPEATPDVVEPASVLAPPEIYTYDSEGRRDPFVSLLARGAELPSASERPDGLLGLSVNEVALRGVVLSDGAYLAVLEAPDGRNHIVRPEDRLFDGSVLDISADSILFVQEVNDPLSLVTEREVRKGLRDAEEGR